jgi:GNAT superfamily N-acetyltransferase
MTSPSIRSAEIKDCPQLAELCTQLGYPSNAGQLEVRLADVLQRSDHAAFVAEVDGCLAGWVHVHVSPGLEVDRMAVVNGLVVDAALRGRGIGKALMAQAEAWARSQGCKELWLRSNIVRKEAHGFYQSLGYEILKTSYTFRKQL